MTITLTTTRADISANNGRLIDVELSDIEQSDLLGHCDVGNVVDYFGVKEILEHIGVDSAKDYFNLTEPAE